VPIESYTRDQVESALFESGYVVFEEHNNWVIYQNNVYPGDDIEFDWCRGSCDWEDIEAELESNGIDPVPIHNCLCHK
jgi:hypothetical protein